MDEDEDEEDGEEGSDMALPSSPPPPSAAAMEATVKLRCTEDLLLDAAIDASLLPPDAPPMLASSKVHTNTVSSLVPLP